MFTCYCQACRRGFYLHLFKGIVDITPVFRKSEFDAITGGGWLFWASPGTQTQLSIQIHKKNERRKKVKRPKFNCQVSAILWSFQQKCGKL